MVGSLGSGFVKTVGNGYGLSPKKGQVAQPHSVCHRQARRSLEFVQLSGC